MRLSFHGASGIVTGSCYYLELEGLNVMIDCGMFQGEEDVDELNYKRLPFDVSDVDYLLLTHAHIDHSGRLPWLIKQGFKGEILATVPTIQLCELMLIDSARIQEFDLKRGYIKRPLYMVKDAREALLHFRVIRYREPRQLSSNVKVEYFNAGHILGSASIKISTQKDGEAKSIVFSGDLGHPGQTIMPDPEFVDSADYVVVESTYGDRTHPPREESEKMLHEEVVSGASKRGNVIIPSFAVERTQEILYSLNKYYEAGEFSDYPVYFDSPLGMSATKVYAGFEKYHDEDAQKLFDGGDSPYEFPNLITLRGGRGRAGYSPSPKRKGVIIAGSGMCTGGKVVGYLRKNLSNPNSSVVFVGYQAEGTLGRRIQENTGSVKIGEEEYKVNARISTIPGLSAHGDQRDLLDWIKHFDQRRLKSVIITHGEKGAATTLETVIQKEIGVQTFRPEKLGDSIILN